MDQTRSRAAGVVSAVTSLFALATLFPFVLAVVAIVHGAAIPAQRWAVPLLVGTAGLVLVAIRRRIPRWIFFAGVALWFIAAALYWMSVTRGY